MKRIMIPLGIVLIVGLAIGVGLLRAQDDQKQPAPKADAEKPAADAENPDAAPKADIKTVSYIIGVNIGGNIGQNFKQQGIDLDVEKFVEGLREGIEGKEPKMSQEEMQKVLMAFQQELIMKQMAKVQKVAEENKTNGAAFLEANKKKEGVKVTDSGLQYKVIKEGTGKKPTPDDTVTVHYKGTLIDGTVFDTSYGKDPVTFEVGGVIPGWSEALQLMKEGAKYQIVLPAELAYGDRGAGPDIGPNAVLVFDVELLKVGEDEPAPDDKAVEKKAIDEKPVEQKNVEEKPVEKKMVDQPKDTKD